MGHGVFIHAGEFTPLHEYDGPDFSGPLCDWVAKGWMDDGAVLAWFWDYDGMVPELAKVERCYAHIGKDGCVFYHNEPKAGRFKVTHIYRENIRDFPLADKEA